MAWFRARASGLSWCTRYDKAPRSGATSQAPPGAGSWMLEATRRQSVAARLISWALVIGQWARLANKTGSGRCQFAGKTLLAGPRLAAGHCWHAALVGGGLWRRVEQEEDTDRGCRPEGQARRTGPARWRSHWARLRVSAPAQSPMVSLSSDAPRAPLLMAPADCQAQLGRWWTRNQDDGGSNNNNLCCLTEPLKVCHWRLMVDKRQAEIGLFLPV